jgi:hypothetical protein
LALSRPSVFVASSSEGLDFARAVRSELEPDADLTLWNEGFFDLGKTFIETLESVVSRFDFAVLVLTADDWTQSRAVEKFSPRDNIIFELGLFMGRLGRERTFILHQADADLKIPSDLAGVTSAVYRWPRQDGSHRSAVGAACDSIRQSIRKLGFSEARVNTQVRAVQDEQARQRADIDGILKFLLESFVTEYELVHLKSLASNAPFHFQRSVSFESELRRLLSLGLIVRRPGKGIRSLFEAGDDVHIHLEITDRGRSYVDYLNQLASTSSTGVTTDTIGLRNQR